MAAAFIDSGTCGKTPWLERENVRDMLRFMAEHEIQNIVYTRRRRRMGIMGVGGRASRLPHLADMIEVTVTSHGHKKTTVHHPAQLLAELAPSLDAASARALCQIAQNLGNRQQMKLLGFIEDRPRRPHRP